MTLTQHIPVLMNEILEIFEPRNARSFLDCTFGGGGHTAALLDSSDTVHVTAVDCDPEAVKRTSKFFDKYHTRFTFHDLNFGDLNLIPERGFDGVLFDLGVSSFQLDTAERGFSFRLQGSADMRLNTREGQSAAEFLETASYEELVKAIREYGEELRWRKVVQTIIDARGTGKLSDTKKLAELIAEAVGPVHKFKTGIHPATRSFQGIRIAVNGELDAIERALPVAFEKLAQGGVLAVISFHSLEDRIVKRFFRRMAGQAEHAGDNLPKQLREVHAKILTNRPITPSEEEISQNPRSRSAKLRVLKKEIPL
jgi:16S rRNA (cytosine1402-N4)-methyltransferase